MGLLAVIIGLGASPGIIIIDKTIKNIQNNRKNHS